MATAAPHLQPSRCSAGLTPVQVALARLQQRAGAAQRPQVQAQGR